MSDFAFPQQRGQALTGSVLKHRHLVSDCLDLMQGLGLDSPRVMPAHADYFTVGSDRLGRRLTDVLYELRPIELRALHARLTGHAVRVIAAA